MLTFVGLKMLGEYWMERQGIKPFDPWVSLVVVAVLLTLSIAASMIATRKEQRKNANDES